MVNISNVPMILTTEVFDTWFTGLRDGTTARRIQARIDRAEAGNFGDHAPVGEGVSEMRIHFGPGFRVYFESTQGKDIALAKELARQL